LTSTVRPNTAICKAGENVKPNGPYGTEAYISVGKRNHKVKVNFTLEQATKAQRGRRGIALLFL